MTLARRTVIAVAARAAASPVLIRPDSGNRLIRAAVHVACWIPFIAAIADSWRGPWRAVGDGARIALSSWSTFSSQIPLVGASNELPHSPHDLGPLQFWLLAIPVHVDPDRGLLWGAAVLIMLAVSLTVEAGYSVLGQTGGLLAGGVVIATVAWFPGFAAWPFDNPNFGMMFFVAAISAALAVLSGHRKWWPVLVVTASIAAQAYLTFAAASVGLVLIAAVTALADGFRAKDGYSWLITGLIAGAACWAAPLVQQFAAPAGKGNMSLLLARSGGQHVGIAAAMKVMASLAAPSSLWWAQNVAQRLDLARMLDSKPAAFGLVILALTAASLILSVCWLRSRELASLAAVSLLVGLAAAASFALIPVRVGAVGGAHRPFGDVPLIFDVFAAVLLAWLTVICVAVVAAVKLIGDRRRRADTTGKRAPGERLWPVRWAAALLVMTSLLVFGIQVANYAGAGTNPRRVSVALAKIGPSLPRHRLVTLSVSAALKLDRYQVSKGLDWALTADGYQFDTTPSTRSLTLSGITVVIGRRTMTVRVQQRICRAVPVTEPDRLCAATNASR